MKTILLAVAMWVVLGGCNRVPPPAPIIRIDARQDTFYAKTICDMRSKAATVYGVMPCFDTGTNPRDIENAFRSAFLADSACTGVVVEDDPHDGLPATPSQSTLTFGTQLNDEKISLVPSQILGSFSAGSQRGIKCDVAQQIKRICIRLV